MIFVQVDPVVKQASSVSSASWVFPMMWPWLMWPLSFRVFLSLDGILAAETKELCVFLYISVCLCVCLCMCGASLVYVSLHVVYACVCTFNLHMRQLVAFNEK